MYKKILLFLFIISLTGCVQVNVDGETVSGLTETSEVFNNTTKVEYTTIANNTTEFPLGTNKEGIDSDVLIDEHSTYLLSKDNYSIKTDRNFDRSKQSALGTLINLRTITIKNIDRSDGLRILSNRTRGNKNIISYYNNGTTYIKSTGNELFNINNNSVNYGITKQDLDNKDITHADMYKLFISNIDYKLKGRINNNSEVVYESETVTDKADLFGNESINLNNTKTRIIIDNNSLIKELRFKTNIMYNGTSVKSYLITKNYALDKTEVKKPSWKDEIDDMKESEEGEDKSGSNNQPIS